MRHLPMGTVTLLFTDIEGSTRLLEQVGEHYPHVLHALETLAVLPWVRSQYAVARSQIEEAKALFEELGDTWSRGLCLTTLARIATAQGEYVRARTLLAESRELYKGLGDQHRLGMVLYLLARALSVGKRSSPSSGPGRAESGALAGGHYPFLATLRAQPPRADAPAAGRAGPGPRTVRGERSDCEGDVGRSVGHSGGADWLGLTLSFSFFCRSVACTLFQWVGPFCVRHWRRWIMSSFF